MMEKELITLKRASKNKASAEKLISSLKKGKR